MAAEQRRLPALGTDGSAGGRPPRSVPTGAGARTGQGGAGEQRRRDNSRCRSRWQYAGLGGKSAGGTGKCRRARARFNDAQNADHADDLSGREGKTRIRYSKNTHTIEKELAIVGSVSQFHSPVFTLHTQTHHKKKQF